MQRMSGLAREGTSCDARQGPIPSHRDGPVSSLGSAPGSTQPQVQADSRHRMRRWTEFGGKASLETGKVPGHSLKFFTMYLFYSDRSTI